jgi:hypothetical protein
VQAGILEDRPADSGVRSALLADPELSERQKQVLLEIYESFRKENAVAAEAEAAQAADAEAADDTRASATAWSAATADALQDDSPGPADDPSGPADDISRSESTSH